MAKQGGFAGFLDRCRIGEGSVGDRFEEVLDVWGCGNFGWGGLDLLTGRIQDSQATGAQYDGGILTVEGDAGRLAVDGLGEAATVFPDQGLQAEIEGDDLRVWRFLVVVEVKTSSRGTDTGWAIGSQSPAREVEEVNALVDEFAAAPVPEPAPISWEEIVSKGAGWGGALPEVEIESLGDGGELAEADTGAAVGIPGAREVDGSELPGAHALEDITDPGNAASLVADVEDSAGPADTLDEKFAFARGMTERGFEIDGFAGFEGEQGGGDMPVVGGGDYDGLDTPVLQDATEMRSCVEGWSLMCGYGWAGFFDVTRIDVG